MKKRLVLYSIMLLCGIIVYCGCSEKHSGLIQDAKGKPNFKIKKGLCRYCREQVVSRTYAIKI